MTYYRFRQNNSGGSFDADTLKGLSREVFIEAAHPQEANERAESLGIYFDGVDTGRDCDCCGDRWYPAGDRDEVAAPEVPKPNEVLLRDDNNKESIFVRKWLKDGVPEAYVHPLEGSFYGAYQTMKHVKRRIVGYSTRVTEEGVTPIKGVGNNGWDVTGNYYSEASPDYVKVLGTPSKPLFTERYLRVVKREYGSGYDVWSPSQEVLGEVHKAVKAYQGVKPTAPEARLEQFLEAVRDKVAQEQAQASGK